MYVISVENLSKSYRLGQIGTGTFANDLNVWWAKMRGKPNPLLRIGEQDHGNRDGDELWALRGVSFTVKQGEVLGIIGRNGAGKSTLLKILSRVTAPTLGRIRVRGRIASLLEVGTGFHPELTGRENIYLNGAILGMKKREITRKFDEIVDFAEVEKFIDTPVKRYSSGMYVRLAFAVAAYLEPEILIVDEVLAVGDVGFQTKCLGKMGEVANEGRTVLYVSHNMGSINSLCKRGIWLSNGCIQADGPAQKVVDAYLRTNTVDSSNNINLLNHGRPLGTPDRFRFVKVTINKGEAVYHGEPLDIEISFETYREIEGISVGFGFSTMEGVRLMTVDSDLSDKKVNLRANLKKNIRLSLPNLYLQPGLYLFDLGARSSNHPLDYLPGCMIIEILPGPSTIGEIVRADGGVRMPAIIDWNGLNLERTE